MALADTARLIAALELQDKFSGPAKKAERSIGSLDRKMGTLGGNADRLAGGLSRAVGTIAKIGAGVAVGGIALLAVNIRKGVDSLNELQSVQIATQTVLKSTDGIAGQSAEGVRKLAEEYESLNATIDDKVIQNAENLLLTFTNVRDKAFEPALEAALNLNEALGGGEEGLQGNIIRVGRALNDPVKGLALLTRAGVQFSEEQKERIKRLQQEGDLYAAQQVILEELTTQFGGRFAAAGQTAEGRMAKLGDTIEDLQQRLAGPLLPAIDKVRDRLITILGTDRAAQAAERIGEAIAGMFTDTNIDRGSALIGALLDKFNNADFKGGFDTATANLATLSTTVGGLPWQAIGDAARLLGTGSKALLDAFLKLPPWVQTAVITGWGLNKLTGGALGGIVTELGKGLIKGVLGMNAGVVNLNAGTVVGGGGGVPGAGGKGGGGLAGGLAVATGVGAAVAAGVITVEEVGKARDIGQGIRDRLDAIDASTLAGANARLSAIDAQIAQADSNAVAQFFGLSSDLREGFASERAELIQSRGTLARLLAEGKDEASRRLERINQTVRLETVASRLILQGIRDKKSTVNVTANFSAQVNVSASNVASQVQAFTKTRGGVYID